MGAYGIMNTETSPYLLIFYVPLHVPTAHTWPQDKRRALEARYNIREDFMSREIVSRIDFHTELSEAYAFEVHYNTIGTE